MIRDVSHMLIGFAAHGKREDGQKMLKQARIIALAPYDTPLTQDDCVLLRASLIENDVNLPQHALENLHRRVLTACRLHGDAAADAYLGIRSHFRTIFVPEHVDRALNSYIDLCEGTFTLEEVVRGADIRLLAPLFTCGITGMGLAHHLLRHPDERVLGSIFGDLHGRIYWGNFTSQERLDARTCLSAFPTCEVVTELKQALEARNRSYELKYLLESILQPQQSGATVTPLFVCPVPDKAE
ncbi:MAG: hypothetical protein GC134_09615 [Proteobacteria bacterium]|nr:hypothetical protein [Pseudomonadota bacterium]